MGNLDGWRGLTIWSDESRISSIEGEHAELLQVRVLQPRVSEENEREALSAAAESMHTIWWRSDTCRCSFSSKEWRSGKAAIRK